MIEYMSKAKPINKLANDSFVRAIRKQVIEHITAMYFIKAL